MKTDGNLYAIEQHLKQEEQTEATYYSLIEEFEEMQGEKLDEVIEMFKHLARSHGVDIEFIDYLRENR